MNRTVSRAAQGLACYFDGVPRLHDSVAKVRCPYCRERVELFVDPDTAGSYVEDCSVCCRPWSVSVSEDDEGNRSVEISPAQ